jgi:hypothetical protein
MKDSKLQKSLSSSNEGVALAKPGEYQAPQVLEIFYLEALAVVCTDVNAKNEVALGCNPGALFS